MTDADNIGKVFLNFILALPYLIVNVPVILFKLAIGMFLYSTKVLSIANISNWWFKWWTGNEDHYLHEPIDTEILNESIYFEVIFETFPQVVIF